MLCDDLCEHLTFPAAAGCASQSRPLTPRRAAPRAGYAYEIQTPLGGWGMEFLLGSRQYALNGILNGIDETEWDPATDKNLAAPYSLKDWPQLQGKAACKAALQKELGLPQEARVPLVAFIGRLDAQKGADLILEAAPWIMQQVCGSTPVWREDEQLSSRQRQEGPACWTPCEGHERSMHCGETDAHAPAHRSHCFSAPWLCRARSWCASAPATRTWKTACGG
jgi:hypothetical protein